MNNFFQSECDALTSTAVRMFKPRSNIPQQSSGIKHSTILQAPIKNDVPTAKDHPPVIRKPELPAEIALTPEKTTSAIHNERQPTPIFSSAEKSPKKETESHDSSALSDYLDDVISCAQAAAITPPKPPMPAISVEPKPQQPVNLRPSPLVYTVSQYRRMGKNDRSGERPQSVIVKPPTSPTSNQQSIGNGDRRDQRSKRKVEMVRKLTSAEYDQKTQELNRKVAEKQTHISQLSRALNVCKDSNNFRASVEEVEAQKNLIVASK